MRLSRQESVHARAPLVRYLFADEPHGGFLGSVHGLGGQSLDDADAGDDDASPTLLLGQRDEHGVTVRGFQGDRGQPLFQFGLSCIRQIAEPEPGSQSRQMLVASLRPTREAADRGRRHADLLGDECEKMERHDLALA